MKQNFPKPMEKMVLQIYKWTPLLILIIGIILSGMLSSRFTEIEDDPRYNRDSGKQRLAEFDALKEFYAYFTILLWASIIGFFVTLIGINKYAIKDSPHPLKKIAVLSIMIFIISLFIFIYDQQERIADPYNDDLLTQDIVDIISLYFAIIYIGMIFMFLIVLAPHGRICHNIRKSQSAKKKKPEND